MHTKKLAKFILPAIVIACAAAYAFVPGTKTAVQQGARLTSAQARYALTGEGDALNVRQVITADSQTSRTIMWQSPFAEDGAVAEYRKEGSEDVYAVTASSDAFTDDGDTTYIHTAKFTDLEPGTAYEYRVGYGQKRSDWQSFRTADGSSDFTALIFPDSQSSDYSVWADTEKPAWKNHQDAQFFINMGDLVDNGQDAYQWNAWFDVTSDMIRSIPVAPVMGNHETYDKNWKVRMPEAYLHLFSLPAVPKAAYQNQFYSFDYGDVHFIVLNTQNKEMSQFQPDLLNDQIAWFRDDVSKTDKKWKVVVMHKDPLQYAFQSRPQPREEGFSEEGSTWMPLFDQYGIDVVLSAHLHTYRDRGHIRDFRRNASGPLYIITGVAGNVRYPSLWKQHSLDEYVAPQPETDNYLVMKATADSLSFTGYLPSGEELHTSTVTK